MSMKNSKLMPFYVRFGCRKIAKCTNKDVARTSRSWWSMKTSSKVFIKPIAERQKTHMHTKRTYYWLAPWEECGSCSFWWYQSRPSTCQATLSDRQDCCTSVANPRLGLSRLADPRNSEGLAKWNQEHEKVINNTVSHMHYPWTMQCNIYEATLSQKSGKSRDPVAPCRIPQILSQWEGTRAAVAPWDLEIEDRGPQKVSAVGTQNTR